MNNELITVIIVVVFVLLVFLVFREVMCWYWKINTSLKNQEEQIRLQKQTLDLLTKYIKKSNGEELNVPEELKYTGSSIELTKEERNIVNGKAIGLKESEVIAIHAVSRIIKKMNRADIPTDGNWIIVCE